MDNSEGKREKFRPLGDYGYSKGPSHSKSRDGFDYLNLARHPSVIGNSLRTHDHIRAHSLTVPENSSSELAEDKESDQELTEQDKAEIDEKNDVDMAAEEKRIQCEAIIKQKQEAFTLQNEIDLSKTEIPMIFDTAIRQTFFRQLKDIKKVEKVSSDIVKQQSKKRAQIKENLDQNISKIVFDQVCWNNKSQRHLAGDYQYMENVLRPMITEGMRELVRVQPEDPLKWFANFCLLYPEV